MVRSPDRREASVIRFLAALGILLAFGIDAALPAFDEIVADLPNAAGRISLIGTVYFLGMAAGQLVFGPLSDRFGRRNALLAGIGLYALGGIAAALATSFTLLLVARAIWGLGAASPAVLRVAIARDLYDGDQMAKVVTIVMAVFLIGPIVAPFLGEAILQVGSWRLVFTAAVALAALAAAWTIRFGETLADDARRPLTARPLLEAFTAIIKTRQTVAHILALTVYSGAFFVYLGSGQPIIDLIYGRGDQFALWFGLGGIVMVAALMVNNRMIGRFGAERVLSTVAAALIVCSLGGLVVALASGGSMSFGIWLTWIIVINALQTLITPLNNSMALEPMGAMAGTASAVLGFISLAGGALLASLIDAQIDTTVMPMILGNVAASIVGFALIWWGRPSQNS